MEEGDGDLVETALREANEELGIPAEQVDILGNLTELFIIASNFVVLPVVGVMNSRPDFKPDSREVVEVIESPIIDLLHPEARKERPFQVGRGMTIRAPYFDINDHHVWGATAMMLSEFLTVYKDL